MIHKEIRRIGVPFFALFVIFSLLKNYKPSSWGDVGIYASGGSAILSHQNPYAIHGFRGGPISAVFLHLVTLSQNILSYRLFQLLSIIGVVLFSASLAHYFLEISIGHSFVKYYWIGLIATSTIAGRALIADMQVTGLTCFLLSILIMKLSSRPDYRSNNFLLNMTLVLVLDLRLQIGVVAILSVVILGYARVAISSLVTMLVADGVLSIFSHQNLLFLEFQKLQKVSSYMVSEGDSTSSWRLVDYFVNSPGVLSKFSVLVFSIVIVVVALSIKAPLNIMVMISLAPLVLTYVHTYDLLIPLAVLGVWGINSSFVRGIWIFLLGFLQPPLNAGLRENLLLVILGLGLISIFWYQQFNFFRKSDFGNSHLTNMLIVFGSSSILNISIQSHVRGLLFESILILTATIALLVASIKISRISKVFEVNT